MLPLKQLSDKIILYLRVKRKPLMLAEWLIPFILIAQGLLWLGGQNAFATSKNYDPMAMFGKDDLWGTIFLVIGLATFALQLPRKDNMRRIALMANALIYTFIGVSFFASFPLTTLAWPFFGVGIITFALFIEIR